MELRDAVLRLQKNEWAPVHESIAGPDIFVLGEGFLVDTSIYLRIRQRVALALQSRVCVRIVERRNEAGSCL